MELPVNVTKKIGNKNNDIEIVLWDEISSQQFHVPYKKDFHQLFLFRIGGGVHKIESEEFSIENYSFHIIPAGIVHCFYLGFTVPSIIINFTDAYLAPLSSFQFYVEDSPEGKNKYIFNATKEIFQNIRAVLDALHEDFLKKERQSLLVLRHAVIIFRLCYMSTKPNQLLH